MMFKGIMRLFGGGGQEGQAKEKKEPEIGPARGFPMTTVAAEGGGEKLSRVELFFLSKFEKPINPNEVSEYLKATIQQDTTKITRRFLRSGLIESASELISLLASTKQVDLKQALKDAGLKVSGKKEELAQRLFENKPELARQLTNGPRFVLSLAGREKVQAFLASEGEADEKSAAEWVRCFDRRDLKGVLAAHRVYSKWEIKPPASFNPMAISLPDDRLVEMYQAIIDAKPGILGEITPSNLLYLQRCAAWNWAGAGKGGSNRFGVPSDFRCALEAPVAVRMIFFSAKHNVDMRSFTRLKIKKVKISACGGGSCSYCQKLDGKTFILGKVPELPHVKCTNEMGCRCIANAEIEFDSL
jgi:hypothetical protein